MSAQQAGEQPRIRPYRETDAATTLEIFLQAVTVTAAQHYSAAQIAAWARPEERSLDEWDQAMQRRNSFVAVLGSRVAGFSDLADDGYIDMLFVSPEQGGRGVATHLLCFVESQARAAGMPELSASVSLTAQPVFERQGFSVVGVQRPVIAGVELSNARMVKALLP
ncbi:GNAT family N-acetyltransferase [Arthrobacter sp. NPDC090010]|uniref:GNAT family N-acetyltransferase n=1 Tax=Arthrobacter sp. NPDC090010 TaxID=3363942 RepID=UPI0037F70970